MNVVGNITQCSYCGNLHNYSAEMCRDILRRSSLPPYGVEFAPVAASNRVPLLPAEPSDDLIMVKTTEQVIETRMILELRDEIAGLKAWRDGKKGVEEFYSEKWAKEQALSRLSAAIAEQDRLWEALEDAKDVCRIAIAERDRALEQGDFSATAAAGLASENGELRDQRDRLREALCNAETTLVNLAESYGDDCECGGGNPDEECYGCEIRRVAKETTAALVERGRGTR